MSRLRIRDEGSLPAAVRGLLEPPREKLGFLPNVLRNDVLRPSHLLRRNDHSEGLMKGEPGLSKAEREMIAVVVSVANDCTSSVAAHSAVLGTLTQDAAPADAVAADAATAPLEPRVGAMLDHALKLTLHPTEMTVTDIDRLRTVGWSDEDVMDVAGVTAMFNLTNRMASGPGWGPSPELHALRR